MITPRWEPDFPVDIRAIVEPYLLRWIPLLPTWCQELRVRYRGEIGAVAQVDISHRNRWALLIIGGNWLDEPEEEREEAIIHELIHVALEPLSTAASELVETLADDGTPLRRLAETQLRNGVECSVDDLARSIQRLASRIAGPNVSSPVIVHVERDAA